MITFEITEIINDILELEEHNLELISLNVLGEDLVGSHTGKYSQFGNPSEPKWRDSKLGPNSGIIGIFVRNSIGVQPIRFSESRSS